MTSPDERRALFHVVRGEPSAAELAALTVVLAAVSSGVDEPPARRDRWSDPAAQLRAPLTAGPGVWRTSAWPR